MRRIKKWKNKRLFTSGRKSIGFKIIYDIFFGRSDFCILRCRCQAVPKKFTPQVHANIGIFADTTISLIKGADLGLSQDQTVFIRNYFDPKRKEEKALLVGLY